MYGLTTSQASSQTQFWILSGPGALTGCEFFREIEIDEVEIKEVGEGRYVAESVDFLGKGFEGASLRSHSVVATQVALNRAEAF